VLKLAAHSVFPTNTLVVVPAMLHALLQQASGSSSYPAVELILIGGQSASDDMLTTLRQVFPNARLVQTYACTEAASSMTFHEPSFADDDQPLPIAGDCVGQPPPHVKLQLVHRAEGTGQVTIVNEPYQVGILATSGPHVMNGYWKRGSQSPPSKRKWFLTNDLGFRCGGGRYYFCGRGKDVIRTGGETVIALEVERVLLHHSGIISECAVFALPDDRFGEAVCVAIVMKAHTPPPLSLQDIRNRYCQSLAGYKRPRRLFFVDTLPRNSSGKVLKYKLVQQFTAPTTSKL
jgi:acyl-CoA synthetase (AMP-forming)/AMP-acid ligase II